MYLRDNTNDVPPRLWCEFADICKGRSDKTVTYQKKSMRTLSIVCDLASNGIVIP